MNEDVVRSDRHPPIAMWSREYNTENLLTMPAARRTSIVKNFRPAAGLRGVYRCGAPDGLADVLDEDLVEAERLLLYDATLIIDLRTAEERDDLRLSMVLKKAPGGPFDVIEGAFEPQLVAGAARQVVRVDVLSSMVQEMERYVQQYGIDTDPEDGNKEKFIKLVSSKGMVVLNECILNDCQSQLCKVLQTITCHLEERPNGKAAVHCTLGKDRTGVIVMLLQAIIGLVDGDMIDDFAASQTELSASLSALSHLTMSDMRVFGSADPAIMVDTLAALRDTYGTVSPNYLDAIGFDESWRERFRATQS